MFVLYIRQVLQRYVGIFIAVVPIIGMLSLSCAPFAQADIHPPKFIRQVPTVPDNIHESAFANPSAAVVDASGNLYVVDTNDSVIQKFNASGNYVTQFNGSDPSNVQFSFPVGIAIASSTGDLFVADTQNNRIEELTSSGVYVNQWSTPYTPEYITISPITGIMYVTDNADGLVYEYDQTGNSIASWGTYGTDPGDFQDPQGIAIDKTGNIFVADDVNQDVQEFASTTAYIGTLGAGIGTGSGQFQSPYGITIDNSGNIYVTDNVTDNVQKFDGTGTYITQWGSPSPSVYTVSSEFGDPISVTTDTSGNVYVVDPASGVQKFTSSGIFIAAWEDFAGNGNGQFAYPSAVAIGASNNLYIADALNSRVQKLDQFGNYIGQWGTLGNNNGQFEAPTDLATDAQGYVYVADRSKSNVQIFDASGNYYAKFGGSGDGIPGLFYNPYSIAVASSTGTIYVLDFSNLIQEFASRTSTTTTPYSFIKYLATNSAGAGNNQCTGTPASVAISPVSGHVYVAYSGCVREFYQHNDQSANS